MDHQTFFSGMYYSLAHLPRRMFVGPDKKTEEMRACQIFRLEKKKGKEDVAWKQ